MSQPLKLTIGIPTFNGARRIGETLDSVLAQAQAGQLEIVVSDNASTDDTETVVRYYQGISKIPIVYSRQPENMGYDRNVDTLFQRAHGDYVWTLADDDVVQEGAISKILDAINQTNADFLVLNFDAYDPTLKEIRHELKMPERTLCVTPSDFFSHAHGRYGQVSSLVINRNRWISLDINKGFGSNYIHIYAVYKIILTGKALVLGSPLLKVRLGSENFGTSGDALISIATSGVKLIHMMTEMGHEKNLVRKLLNESRRYVLDTVKQAKRIGIQNKRDAARNLLQAYNTPKVWLRFVPLIYMPNSVYTLYRKISEALKVKKQS